MDLFPAIDLRHGHVVRLAQGEPDRETRYAADPVAQAERFVAAGARWIHLVDLDAAFGDGCQLEIIGGVAAQLGDRVRLQAGGGFRTAERTRRALAAGIDRVVVGTASVTEPALLDQLLAEHGAGRVAVGLDARDGRIAIRGWQEEAGATATQIGQRVAAQGVSTLIYTEIGRDGMLTGPDLAGLRALREASGCAVIASGGIGSLDHLRQTAAAGAAGAIIGRALYEGRFTLEAALAALS